MIEVYNFLDGKNLCNIFASLVVEELNKMIPNCMTDITVVNVRNFFVVRGNTTSTQIIDNISLLFHEFVKQYDEKLSDKIRVIETINYSKSPLINPINLSYSVEKNKERDLTNLQRFVNDYAKQNLFFNLKIDSDNVYFDCDVLEIGRVKEILNEKFKDKNTIKIDMSEEIYKSDRYYGLNNVGEKYYHLLLKYITYNTFMLGVSKELNMNINSTTPINDMDNLNTEFKINNDNHIVGTSWLESLILDVFPFDVETLKNTFDLTNYNPISEIMLDSEVNLWEKLDKTSEMILL